ncbi:tautomerase [Pseudomonas gingeri]|uniref:tautomerase n=1 Tax=Pseudomonas gingeri TaxID=117681 RepID=UPI0015A062B4|nr:tautomerase [Pseudomonas gingeri]NWD06344.1 tautomerase [Pseudomonas gingeri]NWE32817.1 tautomerase [Pseudomonas gingeri]NWE60430.1 tautomerase [Pseudomonas gingeri]NWF04996.1 tautomerase [Pseudomonas gingeri]
MPNILLKIPKGAFSGDARATLVRGINEAAAIAEQIPADPGKRFLCWVVIEEVEPGRWTCGAVDMTAQIVPCIVTVHVPAGVLDEASRARYVELIQQAFIAAQPADDPRRLMTSVMLHEVVDGAWGANGVIWDLAAFARAAGFEHLQHLVTGRD